MGYKPWCPHRGTTLARPLVGIKGHCMFPTLCVCTRPKVANNHESVPPIYCMVATNCLQAINISNCWKTGRYCNEIRRMTSLVGFMYVRIIFDVAEKVMKSAGTTVAAKIVAHA